MTLTDLDKPAELTLQRSHAPACTVDARSFSTFRAALAVARAAASSLKLPPVEVRRLGGQCHKSDLFGILGRANCEVTAW
ncbi:hypothetical protein [Methylobacterium sp. E-046]|uniref:hypothetical protein n=1 Tax=Methylobacterium sp. E-046 TaxID=2836576 RepID=UPI001FB9810A|nr:hypothetical protein [Methylobacterium sp. E-046]MCJ2103093.1 hypothetical protein [Methylobacterium sp. E-046]